jgi:hypothetical protein
LVLLRRSRWHSASFDEGAEDVDVFVGCGGFVIPTGGRNLLYASVWLTSRFLTASRRLGMTSIDLGSGTNKRDAGEFAAEVGGVALAIFGMVQDGVDIVEDVPFW